MLECFFILYIMALFIAPVPTLVASLGAATLYLVFKMTLLLRHQPREGKQVLWLALLAGSINFFISTILSLALSFSVYFLITNYSFVFLFNLLFCFLISLRWFDFSHLLFRNSVYKLKGQAPPTSFADNRTFVVVSGLSRSTGWGSGLVPVLIDAGELYLSDKSLQFSGAFLSLELKPENVDLAEPLSQEKIRLRLHLPPPELRVDVLLLEVREQFYPFRCRDRRDWILSRLAPGTVKTAVPSSRRPIAQSDPLVP